MATYQMVVYGDDEPVVQETLTDIDEVEREDGWVVLYPEPGCDLARAGGTRAVHGAARRVDDRLDRGTVAQFEVTGPAGRNAQRSPSSLPRRDSWALIGGMAWTERVAHHFLLEPRNP